jgi:hypothetical protein
MYSNDVGGGRLAGVIRASISRVKDAALERALLVWLRSKLQGYGEIKRLNLDTSDKVLRAEIHLRGEDAPLVISEAHYRLEQGPNGTLIILHGVKLSKEWAQNILEDHFREIRLKIPDFLRPLLE